ncbi:hypothetical protein LC040_18210 [Bacillus tianshenii]|nr:hypothetical protein LC040_18210 [Bacillus tianshenii]
MSSFFYRTEEIRLDEIHKYFVESNQERQIINQLKMPSPVILVGSRGVGKSFLFRIAQEELFRSINREKILPIYVTFRSSSLLTTNEKYKFHNWMLSRICTEVIRALKKNGFISINSESLFTLGESNSNSNKIEEIMKLYENSWMKPDQEIDSSSLPSIDDFLNAIEDICIDMDISRMVIFIDEAAHVFLPEQQRQFFTLFRDLRSPYISCNAAVYPGVTVYGDSFQPTHDAVLINLHRKITDDDYVNHMKEIVIKQIKENLYGDSKLITQILERGENFSILAYASSGNPRHLLKTLMTTKKMDNNSLNSTIRGYYRTAIWTEHSNLAEKYKGHKELIDWGRTFIENEVLPSIRKKNGERLDEDKKTSTYFWMHRDAPQAVKEALRLLEYTGILYEESKGIKATRNQIGSRYFLNAGILISFEQKPASTALDIINSLSPRNSTEYGINNKHYDSIEEKFKVIENLNMSDILDYMLQKNIDVLDLPDWQINELKHVGILTIKDVLTASENTFRQIYMVGEVRARRIKSAAISGVYEYLSD